ncbi:amidohydrolase family protein [Nocardiopsis metallicus]|uniref:Putative amidohydrolase YtcJ n=1 Tax=Nocardiopsis metallicus TaxID=179819 RepID=A0A840W1G0_9ACTN|nr:amidohydrolase family protein [Nocardiopsis metallicus]MBB5490670.1 putative amidohydrolase YtcJ [Nocardiopsis metallicus]
MTGSSRRSRECRPPRADDRSSHERLTPEEALTAYTSGVAFQAGAENCWGTLRQGAFADLVRLDRDPRRADPMEIASVTERGTWLSGTRVF